MLADLPQGRKPKPQSHGTFSVSRANRFYRLYSIGMPLAYDVSLSPTPIFAAHQPRKRAGIDLHERGRAVCGPGVSEQPLEKDCHRDNQRPIGPCARC
jgi:hypothetical protein